MWTPRGGWGSLEEAGTGGVTRKAPAPAGNPRAARWSSEEAPMVPLGLTVVGEQVHHREGGKVEKVKKETAACMRVDHGHLGRWCRVVGLHI